MKFLIDNQLPPALARFIDTELGCAASHVADVALREASDAEVWKYARGGGFVLVSKDEDFTHMALRDLNARLIWVRVGNAVGFLFLSCSSACGRPCSSDWNPVTASSRSADRISPDTSRARDSLVGTHRSAILAHPDVQYTS